MPMTKSRPLSILAGKMPADYVVGNGQKPLMRTISAFDARLFANPSDPLVGAHRRIAGFAGLAALKAARIDIVTSTKKRPEECDLNVRRREMIHVGFLLHCFQLFQSSARRTRKLPRTSS